mmetsp:Transcript_26207/g.79606  ORF Transcript_26207/g.79606 Transcript_26207/m.79606 type:complete len:111 (-) Transcript_26207:1552-1884(-)
MCSTPFGVSSFATGSATANAQRLHGTCMLSARWTTTSAEPYLHALATSVNSSSRYNQLNGHSLDLWGNHLRSLPRILDHGPTTGRLDLAPKACLGLRVRDCVLLLFDPLW